MKTVLVTGIAGFIGSKIARKLISNNYKVIGVDDLSVGRLENIPSQSEFINIDLSNENSLDLLPNKCDYVLHLAGQSSGEISFEDPILDLQKNSISTLNLIKYSKFAECKKILYASSMSVYGQQPDKPISEDIDPKPISCYGISKFTSEKYLEIFKSDIKYISIRMFNVYGPGQDLLNLKQGMVSIYLAQAMSNEEIIIKGSLDRFRDFIYIDDVVNSWILMMENDNLYNLQINLGTGKRTSVKELINLIKKLFSGKKEKILEGTKGDQSGIYACTKKLKKYIDVDQFLSIESGIQKFYDAVLEKIN